MSLTNKTIAVTGAASGIGAATAALLKQKGATVIGLDLNEPERNVDTYIRLDLNDGAAIAAAVAQIDQPVDAVCNIAGVPPTAPPALVMQVNFFGLRTFTEALIPKLTDGAAIVNVASIAGAGWPHRLEISKALIATESTEAAADVCERLDITDENSYEISKEVVIVWTMQNWARWQARGIRINAVSPGPVETPILDDFMKTVAVRARGRTEGLERPRPGKPDEIAPVIAFLCDPESGWINGANIPAGGGLVAAVTGHRMGF